LCSLLPCSGSGCLLFSLLLLLLLLLVGGLLPLLSRGLQLLPQHGLSCLQRISNLKLVRMMLDKLWHIRQSICNLFGRAWNPESNTMQAVLTTGISPPALRPCIEPFALNAQAAILLPPQ
jgi:hypothetical protein